MLKILFSFILIYSHNLIAATNLPQASSGSNSETETTNIGYESLAPDMKTLIMQTPELKKAYDSCLEEEKKNTSKVSNCMSSKFTPEIKEAMSKKLKELKDQRTGATDRSKNEGPQYEGKDILQNRTKKDLSLIALEDYFFKKLQKALYQDFNKAKGYKGYNMFSHGVYYKLFETQVGKNIIAAYSNYCLESDDNLYIPQSLEKRKKNRKANLEMLKEKSLEAGKASPSEIKFTSCIQEIPDICHSTDNENKYSIQRACQVVSQVKAARQMLIATKAIQEKFIQKTGGQDRDKQNFDIEKATTITSNEINNEDNQFLSEIEKKRALILKCKNNPDEKICDKLIENNKKGKLAISEYALKAELQSAKLDKLDNKKDLTTYFKEQGYSDSEIKKMLEAPEAVDNLKKEIKEKFNAEKKGLISAMNKRLEAKSINENAQNKNKRRKDIIEEAEKEIKGRALEFKQNIYYNNIVSSYLKINAGKKKISNTRSYKAELANSAFDPSKTTEGRTTAEDEQSLKNVGFKELKENTPKNKDDSSIENGQTTLGVDQINNTLLPTNYQKKADQAKREKKNN